MKGLGISFVVGLLVGIAYGLIRVKSPAPPIVALIGLLGMVLGEQGGVWLLAKKLQVTNSNSAHIGGDLKDRRQGSTVQSANSGMPQRSL